MRLWHRGRAARRVGDFDPTMLRLSGWWRDYAGAPWTSLASSGSSLGRQLTTLGSDPSVGSLNGHGVASYNGVANCLGSSLVPSTLFSVNAGTIIVLFKANAAHTDGGPWYGEPAFLSTSTTQELGLQFSSAGIVAGDYDNVTFNRLAVACGTGAFHMASYTWDGAQMRVRVDGGSFSTTATGAIGTLSFSGDTISSGNDAVAHAVFLNADVAEMMTADFVLSDSALDNVKSYFRNRYQVSL